MEKSKQLINKTCLIIAITILIIFFIESNFFTPFKVFISNYFIFFQGKSTLISNICLGILGSAVLTFVSEFSEYNSIKRKLEGDILRIYIKWSNEIEIHTLEEIDDIVYVELIGEYVYPYWNEISLLYNAYLPYNRKNSFVELIKALYTYITRFKDYIDKMRNKEKKRSYLLKYLREVEEIKSTHSINREQKEQIDKINLYLNNELQGLEKTIIPDDLLLEMINDDRKKLDEFSQKAKELYKVYRKTEVEYQDIRRGYLKAFKKIKKSIRYSYLDNLIWSIKWNLIRCKNFLKRNKRK